MPASPADDKVSLAREMDPDGVGTFGPLPVQATSTRTFREASF